MARKDKAPAGKKGAPVEVEKPTVPPGRWVQAAQGVSFKPLESVSLSVIIMTHEKIENTIRMNASLN